MQLIGNSKVICCSCYFCWFLILCYCSTIINWFWDFLWWWRWWFNWWITVTPLVWTSWSTIASRTGWSPVAVAPTIIIPIVVVAIVIIPSISIVTEITILKSSIESIAWIVSLRKKKLFRRLDVTFLINWFDQKRRFWHSRHSQHSPAKGLHSNLSIQPVRLSDLAQIYPFSCSHRNLEFFLISYAVSDSSNNEWNGEFTPDLQINFVGMKFIHQLGVNLHFIQGLKIRQKILSCRDWKDS